MKIMITSKAFKTLLNVLLSCKCPVDEVVERELINYYIANCSSSIIDYDPIIDIAINHSNNTVFHRLREFFLYSINDFSKENIISFEDVLRHFSTSYHWHLIENGLPTSYKNLIHIPSWFIGHMLVPVKIIKENTKFLARYVYSEGTITFHNIFIPNDILYDSESWYCIHFASVISTISSENSMMMCQQLEAIEGFRTLREDVDFIDYSNYQKYGDYYKISRRYINYF